MNYEAYKNILLVKVWGNASKLIGWHVIHQYNPKHAAKAKQGFFKGKTWKIDLPSQSPDLSPTELAFQNKQELQMAAVQAWQSIPREDTQHPVSMSHRPQAVIARKRYASTKQD